MRSSLSSDQNHFWLDVWLFAKSIWSISKVTRAIAKVTRFRCEKVWTGRMSSVLVSSENRYGRQNHSRSDTFLLICNKRQRKFPPPPCLFSTLLFTRRQRNSDNFSRYERLFRDRLKCLPSVNRRLLDHLFPSRDHPVHSSVKFDFGPHQRNFAKPVSTQGNITRWHWLIPRRW